MRKGLTEMVFILDKSGSMSGYEADTIGGFNSMIEGQKKVEGEALVSTVLFSGSSRVIHDRKALQDVQPLTEREYYVGGNTALVDAIGDAIHHIKNVHKYAREEDVPERTVFIITTDGYENASNHWSSALVKKMIAEQEAKGWEFIFLGANIDTVETGESIGIRRGRCVNFSRANARAMSMYASDMLSDLREGEHLGDNIDFAYNAMTEEKMQQLDELSRMLEKEANEKAAKAKNGSADDNPAETSDPSAPTRIKKLKDFD